MRGEKQKRLLSTFFVACVLSLTLLAFAILCGGPRPTRDAPPRPQGQARDAPPHKEQAQNQNQTHKLPYRPVVIPACLTREQCARLIAHAEPKLARSMVLGDVVTDARTSEQAWVSFDDGDVGDIARDVRARLSALSGVFRAELFEHLQIVRYTQTQQYRPHFDACVTRCDEARRERIPRRATLLVYLTDGFADGATHFPVIGERYKPRAGDGVLFYNVDADTGEAIRANMNAQTAALAAETGNLRAALVGVA